MATPFENTLGILHRDSHRFSLWLITLGLAITFAWLFVAFTVSLPVTVSSVSGRVVSATTPIEISSKSDQPIISLPLRLGDTANTGDVLVAFVSLPLQLELEVNRQRVSTLEQELVSIEQEILSISESLESEVESYDRAFDKLQAGIGETRAEIDHSVHAEKLYRELRSERRIDALEYSRVRTELQQSKSRLKGQEAESSELLANRNLIISRSKTVQSQRARQRTRLKGEIAELLPEQQKLVLRIAELTVRAPFRGEIGAISPVSVGQSVRPGDWLMTLVPEREYEFQAFFAAREAAGRITPEQTARINFHALPWTEYGTEEAIVLRVGSEERKGIVRVDFQLNQASPLAPLLSHGLEGEVVVQIDAATLSEIIMRLLIAPSVDARIPTDSLTNRPMLQ